MEGALTPELWIAVAESTGIPELRRTTRDEPDYDKLMRYRIGILARHGITLSKIHQVIAGFFHAPASVVQQFPHFPAVLCPQRRVRRHERA